MNFDNHIPSASMLTEPGVKYFLSESLKQAHQFKVKDHNTLFNIGLFFFFLIILGILLLWKYKGKLTPKEIKERLSKIYNYQQDKLRAQQHLITGLPHWETEYDIVNKDILNSEQYT